MFKFFLILTILNCSLASSYAKVVDKVVAVINDEIVTLSEINRIKANYPGRTQIASLIYDEKKPTDHNILEALIKVYIIQEKLSELGINIDDESVESRIRQIEKAQGVSRDFLVQYLSSQNISFKEYFQLIKQMMEFSYFNNKIISPLVSVSDQEIVNYFQDKIKGTQTTVQYNVVNFSFKKDLLSIYNDDDVISILKKYQRTGNVPADFQGMDVAPIQFTSNQLEPKVANILKDTKTQDFSKIVVIEDRVNVFYIESRNVVNNIQFEKNKELLKQELMIQKSKETIAKWIDSEKNRFYIKYYL